MRRADKFLLRPTSKQAQALSEMLRDHCSLYNGALQERRDAYRHGSKTSIRYGDQSAQLRKNAANALSRRRNVACWLENDQRPWRSGSNARISSYDRGPALREEEQGRDVVLALGVS